MYQKIDIFAEKKETGKSLAAFLEIKEAENGLDLKTSKVICYEFLELLQIAETLYNQNLKNIAEKKQL